MKIVNLINGEKYETEYVQRVEERYERKKINEERKERKNGVCVCVCVRL